MKAIIGPYRTDIIPVSSWERAYEYFRSDSYYLPEEKYTWYDKIVFGFFDKLEALVRPINHWNQRRKRNIKIKVHYYDVWGLDHTLGIMITPLLKKLKEVKHGVPHVDNEDVPEELRFTLTDQEKLEWDGSVDAKHEARWDWVLDEMIWAFGQYGLEDDTDQFYHNQDQLEMVSKLDENGRSTFGFNHQKDPSKPAYWRDEEGLKKHHERKMNGLRLFAKYYEALWD